MSRVFFRRARRLENRSPVSRCGGSNPPLSVEPSRNRLCSADSSRAEVSRLTQSGGVKTRAIQDGADGRFFPGFPGLRSCQARAGCASTVSCTLFVVDDDRPVPTRVSGTVGCRPNRGVACADCARRPRGRSSKLVGGRQRSELSTGGDHVEVATVVTCLGVVRVVPEGAGEDGRAAAARSWCRRRQWRRTVPLPLPRTMPVGGSRSRFAE